ncbi:MAG TPA: FAD-binding protein [Gaiellaceae bacterium]|nr:FAD-binding protein [Gaiellaceae bacterium]
MVVAGAGMAGLCVAARARELGVTPTVLEKGSRPGGSMLLSSAVIWRYRSLDDFRRECPTGDPRLQRLIVEQLDDALDWLKSLGAPLVSAETANARTVGRRFDPRGLTDVLARAAGDVQMGHALGSDPGTGLEEPLVLATGGFPIRLAREHGLAMRSNPWSEGDGLELGLAAGAATTPGMDEFYGRAMPAPPARWGEEEFVDHAQLYGHLARVFDDSGEGIAVKDDDWSENGLVQEIARRGGRAWFVVDPNNLGRRTPYGTVAEVVERARSVGGTVEERDDGSLAVHVAAAVTHTIGGLVIDEKTRVLSQTGTPIEGLYAAGVDAGGWSTGGYASGLAAALVFGRIAAEQVASCPAHRRCERG